MSEKKECEFEFTQKMADEMNELHDRLFGHLSEETKKALGIKKFKPKKLRYLYG